MHLTSPRSSANGRRSKVSSRRQRSAMAITAALAMVLSWMSTAAAAAPLDGEVPAGPLTVSAVDDDGAQVDGVIFEALTPSGQRYVIEELEESDESADSDEPAALLVELPVGEYDVRISETPEGWEAPEDAIAVTVVPQGQDEPAVAEFELLPDANAPPVDGDGEDTEGDGVREETDADDDADEPVPAEGNSDDEADQPALTDEESGDDADEQDETPATNQPVTPQNDFGTRQLQCNDQYNYSITNSGGLLEVAPDGTVSSLGSWTNPPGDGAPEGWNSLGTTSDGATTYAVARYPAAGQTPAGVRIVSYSGTTFDNNRSDRLPVMNLNVVAGAVDPMTGNFLIGVNGDAGGGAAQFLYEWDPNSPDALNILGYVPLETSGNGDFAFDSAGNLHIVVHEQNTTNVSIYSVTSASMDMLRESGDGNTAAPVASINPVTMTTQFTSVNGISFDSLGGLYLGTQTSMVRVDPALGTVLETRTANLSSSTDLASCNFPITVSVQKNIVDRVNPDDQFELSMSDADSGDEIVSATTTGEGSETTSGQLGPIPVLSGASFDVAESADGSTDMSDYDTTYYCTIDGAEWISGDGTQFDLDIDPADVAPESVIECFFTNDPTPAVLDAAKSATPDSGTLVQSGDVVTYSLTMENTGNSPGEVDYTDYLTGVLGAAEWLDQVTVSPGGTAIETDFDEASETLHIVGTVPPNSTVTVSYEVQVLDLEELGPDASLQNFVGLTGDEPPDPDDCDEDNPLCTEHPVSVPSLQLVKTSDVTQDLVIDDVVTYTFTATNTGNVTLTDVVIEDTDFTGAGELSALACEPDQPATLEPAAELLCTATYEVEQADIDAGELSNAAAATGVPPIGPPVEDEDIENLPAAQNPAIELVKSADPLTDLAVGDVVGYSFTATNVGDVTLTEVEIAEIEFTGFGDAVELICDQPVTLAPQGQATCTAEYTVVQADVDAGEIYNSAEVSGLPPATDDEPDPEPVTDEDDVSVAPVDTAPAIELTKVADLDEVTEAGEVVTYTFTATNTGNVTLTDVVITDDAFSGAGELGELECAPTQPVTLEPLAELVCEADYTGLLADLDGGADLENAASVTGTPPPVDDEPQEPVEDDDIEITPVVHDPEITLVKSAEPTAEVAVDDEVTYTFTATNTGNVTLTDVVITEEAFSGVGELTDLVCDPAQPATLEPSDQLVCAASYTVEQPDVDAGEIDNLASVTGTPPATEDEPDPEPVTDEDDEIVEAADAEPGIALTKAASTTEIDTVGQEVTYTFTAVNTGNVTLTEVVLTEDAFSGEGEIGELICEPGQPATLAPDAEMLCEATYTALLEDLDAGADLLNEASVTGVPPQDLPPVGDEDDETVTVTQSPAVELVKVADSTQGVAVDDVVTYTFTATNVGNVTLTDVVISDVEFSGSGELGELVCDPAQPATLVPGGDGLICTATYTMEQGDVDAGEIDNLASVTGTPPATEDEPDPEPVTDEDDETVEAEEAEPGIVLTKVADLDEVTQAGDVVTYTFTATNTGNVTLSDVVIADEAFSGAGELEDLVCEPGQPATLAPSAELICEASYTVLLADLDAGADLENAASVTGTPPPIDDEPQEPVEDDDIEITPVTQAPDIELVKTAEPMIELEVDDVVTYAFTATNTGNVTLTDVVITDDEFSGVGELTALECEPDQPAVLQPSDQLDCTATYTVEQGDVDAGEVYNLASVTGTPPATDEDPEPEPVVDEDDVSVAPVEAAPSIEVTKVADLDEVTQAGDVVTYTFTATNTGNVTLSDVVIADEAFSGAGELEDLVCEPGQPATLAPSAELICEVSYTVLLADLDAGADLENAASVTGTPPPIDDEPQEPVEDDDIEITPVVQDPDIALVKSAEPTADVAVGDVVTYTFTATNTGNVTLSDVVITDEEFSGAGELGDLVCEPGQPATLQPADELICEASYTVEQGDIDGSAPIENLAAVAGTPPATDEDPDPEPVTDEDDETVTPEPAQPGIAVTKVADLDEVTEAGEVVTYTFTATNTGNVTLSDVVITDEAFSGAGELGDLVCEPDQPATLAPSAELICEVSYTVLLADLDAGADLENAASVTGTPPPIDDEPQDPVDDEDIEITPVTQDPDIALVKSAEPTADVVVGDVVTYTFTATNTGNVTLSDVVITDEEFSGAGELTDLVCAPAQPVTLEPSAELTCEASYTVEQGDIDGSAPIENLATVAGIPPATDEDPEPEPVTDEDDETVTPEAAAPGIAVAKVADLDEVTDAGEVVTYTFTATNTGNVTLADVVITDTAFSGAGELEDLLCEPEQPATLAPSAELICEASYTVLQADLNAGADLENLASVTGTPPPIEDEPQEPVEDEDTEITPVTQAPGIELVKAAEPVTGLEAGDEVSYTFTATNTGTVTLTEVLIEEIDFTGGGDAVELVCEQPVTLEPSEELTCTALYTVVQADVDAGEIHNLAGVSAMPPATDEDPEPSPISDVDDVSVAPVEAAPGVALVKVADLTEITAAGQVVTYTFTATNTGNVTLSDVVIVDTEFSGAGDLSELACGPTQPVTLAPSAELICTATYTVVQDDLDGGGQLTNSATVTATPPSDNPVSDSDDESVTVTPPQMPGLPQAGSDVLPAVTAGVLLLLMGAALAGYSRRRTLT